MRLLLGGCVLAALALLVAGRPNRYDDVIGDLPGVTFQVNFNQYSGYLDASLGNHLHYWFLEAQTNPKSAPLVLWLNGGPGCSSLGGLFTENGPFHPTEDGLHLEENVYAWNKVANMLYLESPRMIGFSYRDDTVPNDNVYNDNKTASDTVLALKEFFVRFPEYAYRDFYVTGESYGGVYIPTLVDALIKYINSGATDLPLNLKGFAIGNGEMNEYDQINSAIDLVYFRGMIDKPQYEALFDCCAAINHTGQFIYCPFTTFITLDQFGNAIPNNYTDAKLQACAKNIASFGYDLVWNTTNDVYNTYQDCYKDGASSHIVRNILASSRLLHGKQPNYQEPFVDQGAKANLDSTDAQYRFRCYSGAATQKYLNLQTVRTALHIPTSVQAWQDCDDNINEVLYEQQHHDTGDVFDSIINNTQPALKILLFNGDADMACNFMGDQWFIERLAARQNMTVVAKHAQWNYTRAAGYMPRGAGFAKRFTNGRTTIDMLTVKGAGHYVPTDRPGPALHMFTNFIFNNEYSHIPGISLKPAALLSSFQAQPDPVLSRKEADRVLDLPGLTFRYDHAMFAGYLSASTGNYIHYWLFESQNSPSTDPLVLWLTGGPGCSGHTAIFTEHGPFHANRDGETLYENVFGWNKQANVLYIESPRGVGFSYQDTDQNPSEEWNDELTIRDIYLSLRDFLVVFPEYVGRSFFITGESYAGIYIPYTASYLIDRIAYGDFKDLKFEGVAIGNGQLSGLQQVNAAIQMQYFHGVYGKEEWDSLQKCCPQTGDPGYFEFCDYTRYVYLNKSGDVTPLDPGSDCGKLVASMSQTRVFEGPQEPYNLISACYEPLSQMGTTRPNLKKPGYKIPGFVDQSILISHESADSQDGFLCWGDAAGKHYLNLPEVQAALHVRESPNGTVQWSGCDGHVSQVYHWDNNDTTRFFDNIISKNFPFRFLIYNGDVDSACNFLADQWFTEKLAAKYNMTHTRKRAAWHYRNQIAGYEQGFAYGNISIDLLTVKGAGHFVPADRPGPALQMLLNFFHNEHYSKPEQTNTELAPLREKYKVDETAGQQDSGPVARSKRSLHEEDKEKLRGTIRDATSRPPPPTIGDKNADKIAPGSLPGFTFDFPNNMYSGYLKAAPGNYLHYWLIEAETDADKKPLVLWLNGGPGCSSLNGLMQELGPFLNNRDGETLYENVFGWHKVGNLLFLESPRDVGYSFTASDFNASDVYSDTETAKGNVDALAQFFARFPEYNGRRFFVSGESYGGVYLPTLADLLLQRKVDGDASVANINLVGIAIGNGIMSAYKQINSAVSLNYFKGVTSKEEYDSLKKCVTSDHKGPMAYFDWDRYYKLDIKGNAFPKNNDSSTLEGFCGAAVVHQGFDMVWSSGNDVYNTYQDCYVRSQLPQYPPTKKNSRVKRDAYRRPLNYDNIFVDEAKRMNYYSTDNNFGYYCYDGMTPYLRKAEVRKALHVPDGAPAWDSCNDNMNDNYYVQENADTTPHFQNIFNNARRLSLPLELLIYNGDADMACQYLGDQWFTEALADSYSMTSGSRQPWFFQQHGHKNLGGYVKMFNFNIPGGTVEMHVLTVKGAGHLVPLDRPMPMLQAIYNFVNGPHGSARNYSTQLPAEISLERKPLKSDYVYPKNTTIFRRQADRIHSLPGLTFEPPYAMHSGYLQATTGNYLFYWLVETQSSDANAPLVLWLNGGPGCSSLGGFLEENGPFRPNPDGRTLFENIYSWNKAAHILYIDSPRQVGFSYQDKKLNNDSSWDDDKTTTDLILALKDFFVAYPHYQKKDFYISGESYAGVYVPLLTATIVQQITAKQFDVNLKGMLVGNGFMSAITSVQSDAIFLYMHGVVGKAEYDDLVNTCCDYSDTLGKLRCPYERHYTNITSGSFRPADDCGWKVENIIELQDEGNAAWGATNDVYNLLQDCYTQTTKSFGSRALNPRRQSSKLHRPRAVTVRDSSVSLGKLDPTSTDATGGFQCYMDNAAVKYMGQKSVRSALHVPSQVQDWDFCNDPVNDNYRRLYHDLTPQFEVLLNSGLPLRVLIYNGDVDTACTSMQAQLFIEAFAQKNGLNGPTLAKAEWRHRSLIAGYQKRFWKGNLTVDLLTVKGSGHFVPTDRPGPTLQMFSAYLNKADYSTPIPYSLQRRPLLARYTRTGTVTPNATTPYQPVNNDTTTTPLVLSTDTTTTTQVSVSSPSSSPPTTSQLAAPAGLLSSLLILLASLLFH